MLTCLWTLLVAHSVLTVLALSLNTSCRTLCIDSSCCLTMLVVHCRLTVPAPNIVLLTSHSKLTVLALNTAGSTFCVDSSYHWQHVLCWQLGDPVYSSLSTAGSTFCVDSSYHWQHVLYWQLGDAVYSSLSTAGSTLCVNSSCRYCVNSSLALIYVVQDVSADQLQNVMATKLFLTQQQILQVRLTLSSVCLSLFPQSVCHSVFLALCGCLPICFGQLSVICF